MENQDGDPALIEPVDNKPQRDERGRLLPGNTANPEGANGQLKGWQPYRERLKRFMEMNFEDLVVLLKDKNRMRKMSNVDLVAAKQAMNMLRGRNQITERESGLDRIEGKAINTTQLQGPGGKALFDPKTAAEPPATEEEGMAAINHLLRPDTL